jgi:hypothetical protein
VRIHRPAQLHDKAGAGSDRENNIRSRELVDDLWPFDIGGEG